MSARWRLSFLFLLYFSLYFFLFSFFYTNSIIAIFAPSDFLAPNFKTLVYPPFLSIYFGAITSKSFFTSFPLLESLAAMVRRPAGVFALAWVINFSTKGLNSLALGSVVFIFSRTIKLSAKELSNARFCVLSLPNFLVLLWCRILFF